MSVPKEQRWETIRALVDAALDLPDDRRAAYVRRECQGDRPLQLAVESLLDCDSSGDSFLEPPECDEIIRSDRNRIGDVVGGYRLTHVLGQGGMGIVYQAERVDGLHDHPVAVKLIRFDIDSAEVRKRFHVERMGLARLEHPNITRFLDGGDTDDMIPYVVMDFVSGTPIDVYCDEQKLSVGDRARLFEQVCSAVQYAHQNLIVHRDLKPANILVTKDGVPKLLDFGLCKLLEDDRNGGQSAVSNLTMPRMTLPYSSPEQIRGQAVSTATDVYSLGSILYELLAGCWPYRGETMTNYALAKQICETQPSLPSEMVKMVSTVVYPNRMPVTPREVAHRRGTSEDRLVRTLRGDLDTITLKALEKDTARRYGSVEQLGEDLRRFRQGQPVRARRDSAVYRSIKFVRRNRLGVAAVVLIVLSLVGGTVGTSIGMHRAGKARLQAVAAATEAQDVARFLEGTLASFEPDGTPGGEVTVRQIINGAVERLDALDADPAIEASLRFTIGRAYFHLAAYDDAERELRRAIQMRSAGEPRNTEAIADCEVILGRVYLMTARYAESEATLRSAVRKCREILGPEHRLTALAMTSLSTCLMMEEKFAEAEPLARQALVILRSSRQNDDDPKIADALNTLAGVRRGRGDFVQAEALYRQSLEIIQRKQGVEHTDSAVVLSNIGNLLRTLKQPEKAEVDLRAAVGIQRRLLGNDHPDLAITLNVLALTLMDLRKYDESEAMFLELIRIMRLGYGESNAQVVMASLDLALLYRLKADYGAAADTIRKALAVQENGAEGGDQLRAVTLRELGHTLVLAVRYEEAESVLNRAIKTYGEVYSPEHSTVGTLLFDLGQALHGLGRLDEAVSAIQRSIDHATNIAPIAPASLAQRRSVLAAIEQDRDRSSAVPRRTVGERSADGRE